MEEIKSFLRKFKEDLGLSYTPYSGRSSEVNHRLAKLMGRELHIESPKEFYDECAKLAKRVDRD